MSELKVDSQRIFDLFTKSEFVIPDYQRPYAWEEEECNALWEDIFSFAIPDNDPTLFDYENASYFLGTTVTFKDGKKIGVIDGQQRLITLSLLLRAFYAALGDNSQDPDTQDIKRDIGQCLWTKKGESSAFNVDNPRIISNVLTDTERDEFVKILYSGDAPKEFKSRYAQNYRFFQSKIEWFRQNFTNHFISMPRRILNNCYLMPISSTQQDTALRIFTTVNDRGKPLSDSDIFKSQFYKAYANDGEKDWFINKWSALEACCNKIFGNVRGLPTDEIFLRYMYYERAKDDKKNKSTTVEGLRKFYESGSYRLFNKQNYRKTFENILSLLKFWEDVLNQNDERFSDRVLKRLFVLYYAPNSMWTYLVSVYFLQRREANDLLNDYEFYSFLTKITAFFLASHFVVQSLSSLRKPVFDAMREIIKNEALNFGGYKIQKPELITKLDFFQFTNQKAITKSLLSWWLYQDDRQELFSLTTPLDIEHIFSQNRPIKYDDLREIIGNKALLEKKINIRASDYKFVDKKKYYNGYATPAGKLKDGTKNIELRDMAAQLNDFTEANIKQRNDKILKDFEKFISENDLLKN